MATIEQNAAEFARKVEAIKAATVDHVFNLGQGLTRQELAQLVGNIDFDALVNQLGYEGAVDDLVKSYVGILQSTQQIAPLSEATLQALAASDKAFYAAKGAELGTTMQRAIAQGILTGQSRSTLKTALVELGGFRPDQVETLVDTASRVFQRTVNVAMMDEMPDSTKYFYFGPVDGKTRDICLEMAAAGEMTQDEIVSKFGASVLTDGGGFNCRHEWRLVTSQSSKLEKSDEAQERIDADQ